MKILFLSSWYPYPTDNGSKLRVFNLLRGLAEHHQVTLLSFTDQPQPATPPELDALCRHVHTVSRLAYHADSSRALAGLFSLSAASSVKKTTTWSLPPNGGRPLTGLSLPTARLSTKK